MSVAAKLRAFVTIPGAWPLLGAILLFGCGLGILVPMNAIYLEQSVHLSKFQISALISIELVLSIGTTFVSGFLSDGMRRRKPMPLIASVLTVIGLLGYDHAHGFVSALVFYFVATAPENAVIGQLYAMARTHLAQEAPDLVYMGIVWLRTLFSVGFVIGLLLGAALYTAVTFHGLILGNAACFAILFVLFLLYRERAAGAIAAPSETGSRATGRPGAGTGPRAEPPAWSLLAGILLLMCADAVRSLYFPLMVNALYHRPTLVSRLWTVQAVCEFGWMTLAGLAAARYGDLRVVACGALCALGVYVVYANHPTLPFLFAAQPVYSVFVSVNSTVVLGTLQRMFAARAGFGSSMYFVLSQMASLVGYMVPNVIAGFSPHIFYLAMAFAVAALLMLGRRVVGSGAPDPSPVAPAA